MHICKIQIKKYLDIKKHRTQAFQGTEQCCMYVCLYVWSILKEQM